MRRDVGVLYFWPCRERHVAENTSACVDVAGVDARHAVLRRWVPGVGMTEPRSFDHDMRELHPGDPDANPLRFGEPVSSR